MKIFTIESGSISEGVEITSFHLKKAGAEIPAIIVGEEGRGRELGILPVGCLPIPKDSEEKIKIMFGEIGETKTGRPKIFKRDNETTTDSIIVVLKTKIGFRGANAHTGDRTGSLICGSCGRKVPMSSVDIRCECGGEFEIEFLPFPGEILVKGIIAEGDAGRMGSGEQIICIIPKNTVFRTAYFGRLYGAPMSHYYKWDGVKLFSLTWEERQISEIF